MRAAGPSLAFRYQTNRCLWRVIDYLVLLRKLASGEVVHPGRPRLLQSVSALHRNLLKTNLYAELVTHYSLDIAFSM